MKNNLSKKINKAVAMAQDSKADFEGAVLVTPEQVRLKRVEEKRTRKIHTYIKPSEYDQFISLIGRRPTSDALRSLLLKFNQENNGENKEK